MAKFGSRVGISLSTKFFIAVKNLFGHRLIDFFCIKVYFKSSSTETPIALAIFLTGQANSLFFFF